MRNKRGIGVSLNAETNCAIALVLGIDGFFIGSKKLWVITLPIRNYVIKYHMVRNNNIQHSCLWAWLQTDHLPKQMRFSDGFKK